MRLVRADERLSDAEMSRLLPHYERVCRELGADSDNPDMLAFAVGIWKASARDVTQRWAQIGTLEPMLRDLLGVLHDD